MFCALANVSPRDPLLCERVPLTPVLCPDSRRPESRCHRSRPVQASCGGCPGPLPMCLCGIHSQLCQRVFPRVSSALSLTSSRPAPQPPRCRLASAAVLGPCQCVSAGSNALRACFPSPLVLCPDSRRPESRCLAASRCRLAAEAVLGPCQCVYAGSTALRACSFAFNALSRLQAT